MQLYASSEFQVMRIRLYDCSRFTTCQECVGARDPHCGWCDLKGRCVHVFKLNRILNYIESNFNFSFQMHGGGPVRHHAHGVRLVVVSSHAVPLHRQLRPTAHPAVPRPSACGTQHSVNNAYSSYMYSFSLYCIATLNNNQLVEHSFFSELNEQYM